MKNLFILALLSLLFSSGSYKPSQEQKDKADRFIESLCKYNIDNIYGGTLTDSNILVLSVDAYPGANFDIFAKTYLEKALK